MPRNDYRLHSRLSWQGQSGNALLALVNKVGSGKKISVRSLEIYPQTHLPIAGGIAGQTCTLLQLVTNSHADKLVGRAVPVYSHDSTAASPAADLKVLTDTTCTVGALLRSYGVGKQYLNGGTCLAAMKATGRLSGQSFGALFSARRGSAVEAIVLRPGEVVSLLPDAMTFSTLPLYFEAEIVIEGSPNRTYYAQTFNYLQPSAVLTIANTSAAKVVRIQSLSISEVGSLDSPYFMVVPTGVLEASSESDALYTETPARMDSAAPAWSNALAQVYTNCRMRPLGMPESALAEGSVGIPKGFNYLQTKDFIGPVWATFFPELAGPGDLSLNAKGFGWAPRWNRLLKAQPLGSVQAVVLREGEGIAIVSAAELATGATVAAGTSGWSAFEFGLHVSVEPATTPAITLTGLVPGTEIHVYTAAGVQLATTEASGTTFSWTYEADDSAIYITVLKAGYQWLRFNGLTLNASGVTIPVQQTADRNYRNP